MENRYNNNSKTKSGYVDNPDFEVKKIECVVSEKETMYTYTSILQSMTSHPIARAILKVLPSVQLSDHRIEKVEEIQGGVKGFIDEHEVIIGDVQLMKSYDFYYDESLDHINEKVVLVMIDDRYTGCFIMKEMLND